MKRIAILIIVCFTLILVGCNDDPLGIKYALSLKDEEHIDLKPLDDSNGLIAHEYEGNVYYMSPINFYVENLDDDYIKLGWIGERWGYHYSLYGDSRDDPTFFYFNHSYFIKETFDYETELFNIKGTSETLVFCQDLVQCDEVELLFGMHTEDIFLSSVKCPKMKILLFVFEESGEWYASTGNRVAYKLSNRLINILNENQLINTN